jgi:UPF0755 protein
VSVILCAAFAFSIPARAEVIFGKASPNLDPFERFSLSISLISNVDNLQNPANPGGKDISFSVDSGESAQTIIQKLSDAGLITKPDVFRDYLIYSGIDTRLQTGTYKLNLTMTPIEIANTIQSTSASVIPFQVFAGWRLEEIAAALPTSGLRISPETFIDLASKRPEEFSFIEEFPIGATGEGFLFPTTYSVSRDTTGDELLTTLLNQFDIQVTEEIRSGFSDQGLTLYEAVTLASIVERESVLDEEQPMIASVFINRFFQGIKLEADPTVQYALGYSDAWGSWWKNPLSLDDLQVDSPYNTYLYEALPPTPISNPGLSALESVAFPIETNFLYFRAACDGSGRHVFARTFEEHQINACPQQ